MLDDLYWIMSYSRWKGARFWPLLRDAILRAYPSVTADALAAAQEYDFKRYYYQGIGRYEPAAVYDRGIASLQVLANLLPAEGFLFRPEGARHRCRDLCRVSRAGESSPCGSPRKPWQHGMPLLPATGVAHLRNELPGPNLGGSQTEKSPGDGFWAGWLVASGCVTDHPPRRLTIQANQARLAGGYGFFSFSVRPSRRLLRAAKAGSCAGSMASAMLCAVRPPRPITLCMIRTAAISPTTAIFTNRRASVICD